MSNSLSSVMEGMPFVLRQLGIIDPPLNALDIIQDFHHHDPQKPGGQPQRRQ